jgi:hypothetical protein
VRARGPGNNHGFGVTGVLDARPLSCSSRRLCWHMTSPATYRKRAFVRPEAARSNCFVRVRSGHARCGAFLCAARATSICQHGELSP